MIIIFQSVLNFQKSTLLLFVFRGEKITQHPHLEKVLEMNGWNDDLTSFSWG